MAYLRNVQHKSGPETAADVLRPAPGRRLIIDTKYQNINDKFDLLKYSLTDQYKRNITSDIQKQFVDIDNQKQNLRFDNDAQAIRVQWDAACEQAYKEYL